MVRKSVAKLLERRDRHVLDGGARYTGSRFVVVESTSLTFRLAEYSRRTSRTLYVEHELYCSPYGVQVKAHLIGR